MSHVARLLVVGLTVAVLTGGWAPAFAPVPALEPAPASAAITPCSRGLVALTFDDGPRAATTPAVLDALARRRVRGTFFVVGRSAAASPSLIRREVAQGHVVANHTWGHERLTALSDARIRDTLRRTNRAIAGAGAPTPTLMRPPYGATNSRVRSVVAGLGMRQVMWSVDPQDWRSGRSASTIASLTLRGLAPGAVVVLHDGVANSGQTARALPTIIDTARARGYCFGALDPRGRIAPPVPAVSVADVSVTEGTSQEKTPLTFTVALSEPTTRSVAVAYGTADGSAVAPADYRTRAGTLEFKPGQTRRTVTVPVVADRIDEPKETFTLRLSAPVNATLKRKKATATIVDDDLPPALSARDVTVDEGPEGAVTEAAVRVTLSRRSGRRIEVAYATADGTAVAGRDYERATGALVFKPGQTERVVRVAVRGNDRHEDRRAFVVRLSAPTNASLKRAAATVTIRDDDAPPAAEPDGATSSVDRPDGADDTPAPAAIDADEAQAASDPDETQNATDLAEVQR